jgi:hypothetical protein
MKTLIVALATGLFATVTMAQSAPAAKVDCKDPKNAEKTECKAAVKK